MRVEGKNKMKLVNFFVIFVKLLAHECEGKGFYTIVGTETMAYQQQYPLAVASDNFGKPETFELMVFGKLEDGGIYENKKNVTLKGSGMQRVEFDLKDQTPGNYYLKMRSLADKSTVKSARLNLNTKRHSVLIQMDKAIYKPSDKVQFRVMVVDSQTKPIRVENMQIFISDPDDNRVKQFDKVHMRRGVFRHEFQLSDEPLLGVWKIHAKLNAADEETVKTFEVDEYVLPTFEVKISAKENWRQGEDIVVSYSAMYTYGKEVEGEATLTAAVNNDWWWEAEPLRKLVKVLNSKTATISPRNDLNILTIHYVRSVLVTISFREFLTNKTHEASTTVFIYEVPFVVEMRGSSDTIKPQLPFTVTTFVRDINQVPVSDSKNGVLFKLTYTLDELEPEVTSTTTKWSEFWWRPPRRYKEIQETFTRYLNNGIIDTAVRITPNVTAISMSAQYTSAFGYFYANSNPTASNQYIEMKTVGQPSLGKQVVVEVTANANVKYLNYIVLGKSKIVTTARLPVGGAKKFKFTFKPTIEMVPMARVIAYYLTSDGEIISDRLELAFESDLANFVTIDLSKTTTKPSTLVNLTLRSMPNSYVGLLGVDQSVLLLKSGNDIDRSVVDNELLQYLYANQYNTDWEEETTFSYFTDFASSSVVIFTNAKDEFRQPYEFFPAPANFVGSNGGGGDKEAATTTSRPVATSISPESIPSPFELVTRKHFPETWLFDCVENTKGTKTVTRIVPDTITSWIITGFSINSENGLGLTRQPTTLTVFMPFFVSLNLPYSIKRGESVAIEVNVFNYLSSDIKDVVVTLRESSDFKFISEWEKSQKITAKANAGTSLRFRIKPLKIGYISLDIDAIAATAGDRIQKLLLVESEGVTEFINEAVFIDLKSQDSFTSNLVVKIPVYAIRDTVRVEVSVIGDLLGPTIENLGSLINLPSGCGEQNMLNFVPDIVVLDYLTSLNKLTAELRKKLISYLEIGYQRELTYKHVDGSYSAFGSSDQHGSTWLTAFVVRSFAHASKYITVDARVILDGLTFLARMQDEDGGFSEHGVVFHKAMQGGAANGLALTAYTLLTFLENQQFLGQFDDVKERALDHVEAQLAQAGDGVASAIAAYALALAGRERAAGEVLRKFSTKFGSVETTAYLLLAYDRLGRSSDALLAAKWLVRQRNQFGGFDSTQDTVVGIAALARIAAKIATDAPNVSIGLRLDGAVSRSVNVTEKNALVLQKLELAPAVRSVEVAARGVGFCLLQLSYRYNHLEVAAKSLVELSVSVSDVAASGYKLTVCVGIGEGTQSNMAVVEASTVSGFVFSGDAIDVADREESTFKKFEYRNGGTLAVLYFNYFTRNTQCLGLGVVLSHKVDDKKPAVVIAYDYYETDNLATAYYTVNS